jgi:chromosome segregation protein
MAVSTKFAQRESDLNNRQQGKKYIEDNIANLKEQILQKTNRIADIELSLQEILTLRTGNGEFRKYNDEIIEKETALQLVKSKRDEIIASIESKNIVIHETKIKVEALRQEVSNMEGDQKSFITQKNFLETRIRESYGKTFEELKDQYLGVEVDRETIDKIKKKMEDMGQVNMAAQEEYDQLSQRYDFIVTQQNDLIKAKKDLEEVIQKINQTTVENFKKTFDVV